MRNDRDVMVNLKLGIYKTIIFFQSVTRAAQKKKSVYTTHSSLVPRPVRAIRVSGRVLEPSLTRLTGDVTFETAKDERERGKYQQESKSVWMTKIKHKFTFGGSLPSSIMRVSPLFTCEFSSVSSYELEKKGTDNLSFDFEFAWSYDWFKRWALGLV